WCTKTLASTQLAQGDFYVFVDKDNKPHIAVKTSGNEIDEVRGILNGNAQELEEDYRKVALSFLENNKEIKNGDKWLRKEEWNKRLIKYIHDIENGIFKQENIEQLIEDFFGKYEYKSHGSKNTNKEKLKRLLPKIKKNIAEYYNCNEEEIAVEDINFSDKKHKNLKTCPYKVIFGNADFSDSRVQDLGNLTIIGGNPYFYHSKVQSLNNLTTIGGNVLFSNSRVQTLGNLTTIGGYADFSNSQIYDLGNLTTIGGNAWFYNSKVQNLGNLTTIGRNADFRNSQIKDLGNLTAIGGLADFKNSKITDFDNIEYIGGNVNADPELMELYYQEFDETGHRIHKENSIKR
ncbi:MAG: hypothetical protein IJK67_03760, partial [Bacilli bacterium]|nr:hypothetical protein [Bacilli bacterium]